MIFHIDNNDYHLDITGITRQIFQQYHEHKNEKVLWKIGSATVDFSRKSLLRLGFKSTVAPILVTVVKGLYASHGLTARAHVKHEDILDYLAEITAELIYSNEKDAFIYAQTTTAIDGSRRKNIIALSTVRPAADNGAGTGAGETPEAHSGGGTLGNSGKERDGENNTHQGTYRDKAAI